ncbi:hypothetical protein [Hymenobacter segetis]|uniref:Uncharacterized protein n=1 Tax=Hymenobacter segetis TaxID=2025509 RepID=A0ABU9LZW2_9BACT
MRRNRQGQAEKGTADEAKRKERIGFHITKEHHKALGYPKGIPGALHQM